MKYYNESTGQELSRRGVEKAVYPTSLAKGWGPEAVIAKGFYPIIKPIKPDITPFQKLELGTPVKIGNEYHYTWSITDKFSDIPGGDTKEIQEANYLEILKTKKITELAQRRYTAEITGITVNGSEIKTDRESQAMITGAYNAIQINPNKTIDWKGTNGWATLNATAITAIASAVADHVQACFTREKELTELINAVSTFDELEAINIENFQLDFTLLKQ